MKLSAAVEGMIEVLSNEHRDRQQSGDREWLMVEPDEKNTAGGVFGMFALALFLTQGRPLAQ